MCNQAMIMKCLMLVSVDRQRTGEDMSGLNLQELCHLQENITESVAEIRERKVIVHTLLFTFFGLC